MIESKLFKWQKAEASALTGMQSRLAESYECGGWIATIYTEERIDSKEVQQAIYDAQARLAETGNSIGQTDVANEIAKFHDLKEKGVISQEEFDKKKKQLLGL